MRRFVRWLTVCVFAAGCGSSPELVHRPAGPGNVVVRDVGVLDVDTGAIAPHRDVVVENGRIAAIVDTGQARVAEGTPALDGKGATLLPGLIDMHGHISNSSAPPWQLAIPDPDASLRAYLYCGVTTVLDPGDLVTQAFTRRAQVASGALLGPHIFAAGPMLTAPGGHPIEIFDNLVPWYLRWYLVPRATRQLDSPEAARAAVKELADLHADVIKLAVDAIPADGPRLRREVIAAAVDEGRQRGVRAVAHIGTVQDAIDAADGGVAAWMHGVYKERIPDDQIARFAGYRIPMVATMEVFDSYARLGQGPRVLTPLERETVPASMLAAFDTVPDVAATRFFAPFLATLRTARDAWRDNVRRLRGAGVTILAGSDTQAGVFPGAGLHRELHQLLTAGLTPAEAIRTATSDAARFLANGQEPTFGQIKVGLRADLLLVDGDPTADLDALARIRAVILEGLPLDRRPVSADGA